MSWSPIEQLTVDAIAEALKSARSRGVSVIRIVEILAAIVREWKQRKQEAGE